MMYNTVISTSTRAVTIIPMFTRVRVMRRMRPWRIVVGGHRADRQASWRIAVRSLLMYQIFGGF